MRGAHIDNIWRKKNARWQERYLSRLGVTELLRLPLSRLPLFYESMPQMRGFSLRVRDPVQVSLQRQARRRRALMKRANRRRARRQQAMAA